MNIGIVINTSWNIFNFRMGLANALIKEGHQVFAIAPEDRYSSRLEAAGIKFIPVKLGSKSHNPFKDIKLVFDLTKIYRENKLDFVLHFTIKPNIYGSIATFFCNAKAINNVSGLGTIFIRQNLVTKLVRRMYSFSFKFAKHVFFQNNDDVKLFVDLKIVDSNNVSVLPGSGIPLDKITFSPRQYSNETRKFFMPSRLLIDKGVGEYVEVCRQIKLEYGDKVEFYLAGKAEENPKLGFGIRTARSWNKDGFINYIGRIDDSLEWMRNSDVVVLPSYREGTPRSLLEAASLGRPIVTTNVPGCKEVVIDQQNGLLCEAKNTKSLYNCIKSMIDADSSSLETMGEASRKLVENKFDEQIVINSYKKIIEKFS